ncbi:MAG: symmetrical bis(5'-nucleosyl)-tetraphosphatase [Gammaproteobacteria bacterium]|nr:symmetrical bis(5'-nucleosyl)-tetraphosphatase [Gammaproteobacteria bacterium]
MSIYAIGDLQGCAQPLESLLDKIRFDPAEDQIWLAGDLVNRGPDSLRTLHLLKQLGSSAVCILGNHDLHLLAVAAGKRSLRSGDTLQPILESPDRDELLYWLRHLPLLHTDHSVGALVVHAGVYPSWGFKQLKKRAAEVETVLRSPEYSTFFEHMYGKNPTKWDETLSGWDRLRFITNTLTRMRYCDLDHNLDFAQKGSMDSAPKTHLPWFRHPSMKCRKWKIIFGHWSTLGFFQENNVVGLDSGCVWGGKLTAIELDGQTPGKYWQLNC